MWDVEFADGWLLDKLSSEPNQEILIRIAIVLSGIWFARNKKIFENKDLPPAVAMRWSKNQVVDWRKANRKPLTGTDHCPPSSNPVIKWNPPSHGTLKVNVHATVTE